MSIKTDSKSMEEAKDPETCLVFTFYKLFADEGEQRALAERYRAGGMGYGHAKQELFEKIDALLNEPRERYMELQKRPDDVHDILNEGAKKARLVARGTLDRVRLHCGL